VRGVLTLTAIIAGAMVVGTDDAQAGLLVLLIPTITVPLGFVLWVVRLVLDRRGKSALAASPRPNPPQ